ncbi:MAG: FecR domain-containing protein [Bacteroidota bacterium]
MLDPLNDETLLARWLSGDLSATEVQALQAHEDFPAFQQIIDAMEQFEAPAYDEQAAWKQLAEKAGIQETPTKVKSLRPIHWVAGIAAAVLFVVTAYLFWPAGSIVEFTAKAEPLRNIELPDGSIVHLNADSKLAYHQKQFLADRVLQLDGSAYFKVKKYQLEGQSVDFLVETDKGFAEVLGTEFLVDEHANAFQVVVYEGKVAVLSPEKEEKGQLTANQAIRWNDQEGWKRDTAQQGLPTWLTDRPVREIFAELEKEYDLTINLPEDKHAGNFRGNLSGLTPEEQIKEICLIKGWTYTKSSSDVYDIVVE